MSDPMSIGRRILVLVIASLSLLLVLLVSSLILTYRINAQVTTLTGNVIPSLEIINGVAVKFASIRATTLRYMLAKDDADRVEQARKLVFFRQGLDRDLNHYESEFVVDQQEKALLQQVRQAVEAFDSHQFDILAVSASSQDVRSALAEAQAPLGQVSNALRRHHDYSLQLAESAVDASRFNLRVGVVAMVLLTLVAAVSLLAFGYRIRFAVQALTEGFRKKLVDLGEHGTQVAAAAADLLLASRKLSEVADCQRVQVEQLDAAADDIELGIPAMRDLLAEAQEQVAHTAHSLSHVKNLLESLVQHAGQAQPGLPDELFGEAATLLSNLDRDVQRSGAAMAAVEGVVEAQCRSMALLVQQVGKVARLAVENTSLAASASASAMSLSVTARGMNDEVGRRAA
ncbi:MCP four helix bundle domain-containing protein [Zoogloea sp.]|uniref:MCP four helix bundle domain-containing protein n=1 Tax=Zoogloea sp. TaxID=49181 RepID=UPI0031FC673C